MNTPKTCLLHASLFGCALALGALGPAGPARAANPVVNVKILALNDFHGNLQSPGSFRANEAVPSPGVPAGGVDYLAGYIAAARAANPYTAVVSAGDLIGASPLISALFHDEGSIETMNRAGLDFNAVGNHEFDEGKTELLRMQAGGCHPTDPANSCKGAQVGTPVPFEGAKFKFLAANVVETATGKTLFAPYGIKQYGAVRVAFIGMTLKGTPSIVTPSGVAGLDFKDEAATVNALVPKLRARGVEAIVVLIHEGGAQLTPPSPVDINGCVGGLTNTDGSASPIKAIVAQLDNAVDLVVSGHTHSAYNCQLPLKGGRLVPVTSANAQGRVLTEIDLAIDAKTGHVKTVAALNKVVDRSNLAIAANAQIQGIVDAYAALVAPIANTVIGAITTDLPSTRDAACNVPAGDLIADSQLQATAPSGFGGARVAFMNPGGVRSPGFTYPSSTAGEGDGNITYGEAFTVQPFGNSLVTMTLTHQQLKNALEQQFNGCALPGEPAQTANRLLLPSVGLKYSWNLDLPLCARIQDVTLDGVALVQAGVVPNPTQTLRVTVNNFLADGGDGFSVLKGGTDRLGGAQDIDALIAYLSAYPPGSPYDPAAPTLGKPRIVRTDAGSTCP